MSFMRRGRYLQRQSRGAQRVEAVTEGIGRHHQDGIAVAREEGDKRSRCFARTERYFAQTIFAKYLTSTTWKRREAGWKLIAAQTLAERTDPPAITLPASRLAQYVGTYQLKDSEPRLTLELVDGKLIGTRSGRKAAPWNAEASDVFFIAGDPRIRRIFQRDASGKVTGFVERRESWDIVWVKTG